MPTGPHSAFGSAAVRHYRDAELLHADKRFGNADHLAGIAAECALKAVFVRFLGGTIDERSGRPFYRNQHNNRPTYYGHLPQLWTDLSVTAHGRTAANFMALISGTNPFTEWDVNERYSSAQHIDETRSAHHLNNARTVLMIYQQADLSGELT